MKWLAAALALAACSTPKEANPQAKNATPVAQPASKPEAQPESKPASQPESKPLTMWNAPIKTLQGEPTTLAAYRGKALLLVNVASRCGLTPQYAQLEELHEQYGPKGFSVIGFPCNQFRGQEPGSPEQIAEFCRATYGVTFPLMEKIEVNGEHRHPIYEVLTPIADADGHSGDIRWNFEKFVVSADGSTITRFAPKIKPNDPRVVAAIEAALPK